MSNIRKNFFNQINKTVAKVDSNAKLPQQKNNTTFDSNYKARFISRMTHTLTKKSVIPVKNLRSNNYKKNGKPKKPNVGSMDRLLRLKASAFSAK